MHNEWIKTFKNEVSANTDNVTINGLLDKLALVEMVSAIPVEAAKPVFLWNAKATGILMKQFR